MCLYRLQHHYDVWAKKMSASHLNKKIKVKNIQYIVFIW